MSPANFDVLKERMRLVGRLTTQTALRIGSGGAGHLDAADLPVLRDADGFPLIPGGSFKGVLRSTIEALLRAAARPDRGVWACDPLMDKKGTDRACGVHDSGGRPQAILEVDKHCAACRLFGSRILASHVRITDAHVRTTPEARATGRAPVEIRDGVAIDRDLRHVRGGLKYDFEVVSPGAVFDVEIFVENPDRWLLGLLAIGLDQIRDGFSAIGGFTSRGLGRVTLEWDELHIANARDLLEGKPVEPKPKVQIPEIMQEWRDALSHRIQGGA